MSEVEEAIQQFSDKYQAIGEMRAKHNALEQRVDRMETSMSTQLKSINEKLDRPSWAVVTIITLLSSGFFSLLTVVVKEAIGR